MSLPRCQRCNSLMGWIQIYTPSGKVDSLNCLVCGWTVDPEIIANRVDHKPRPKGCNKGPHKRRNNQEGQPCTSKSL